MAFHDLWLHVDIEPNSTQQLFMADEPSWIVNQKAKNVEALRRQIDAIFDCRRYSVATGTC